MEPEKPEQLEGKSSEAKTSVGIVDRVRDGIKEDIAALKTKTSKESVKAEVDNLKDPTKTQLYKSIFRVKHEPGNPAADASGNVKYPNVNPLVEMTDMREAQRSYEANLNIISATRRMIQRTLDILKA